jgi:hypothetical protein
MQKRRKSGLLADERQELKCWLSRNWLAVYWRLGWASADPPGDLPNPRTTGATRCSRAGRCAAKALAATDVPAATYFLTVLAPSRKQLPQFAVTAVIANDEARH